MAIATEPLYQPELAPVFPYSDRYTYVATIGQGGMGVIYRALDRDLGHEVALKVLRARDHDAISRLKTEFRARVDLHHPHLLQLLDLVVTIDEAFFTMELVDAVDFLDWVWQAGEADARRRLASALAGVASALDALHAAGWVHFDVKPPNILVDRTGRALLADFGLSTAIRTRAGEPARDLEVAGTPDYMAPERGRGGFVTPASDLFSLGAVIVEALTGSPHDDAVTPPGRPQRGSPQRGSPQRGSPQRGSPPRDDPPRDDSPPAELPRAEPRPASPQDTDLPRADTLPVDPQRADTLPVGPARAEPPRAEPPRAEPPPADVPRAEPLLALARRLTARDPATRPTARDAAAELAAIAAARPATHGPAPRPIEPPFVGRDAQLAALAAGFARVDAATTVIAEVHGPSGIGKTMLVGRFLDRVAAVRPDAIVLRGRCHPYEQIAFGGVDRIVDGLAECVRDGEISLDGITPSALVALVRLFPTLPWRVPATASALTDDDHGLRLLGIAALRELLARAAAARGLVMWIDDLHWMDDDTEEVLAAIAGVPNAMVVYSYRLDDAPRLAALRSRPAAGGAAVHRVELALGALDAGELEALVRAVAPGVAAEDCRELAVAAAGSPIFARILGRHGRIRIGRDATAVAATGPAGAGTAGTERATGGPAALWNQLIDGLPAPQRALFDAIAVAPGPVAAAVVKAAASVEYASPELRALEQLGIVSRAPGRGSIRFAPLHDQLRQVRLDHMAGETRARLHRELARSHEQAGSSDYEALVHHFHALAEDGRAGHYAALAGDRASASLAFGTAASYYARALEWLPVRAEPWELHRKLAECEASRGHFESAGLHFERAARERAEGERTGSMRSERTDSMRSVRTGSMRGGSGDRFATTRLAMRAAEQLLRCGRIPDGYRIMRDVLAKLRVRLPGSQRAALLHSAVLRARLVLRGLDAVLRSDLAPEQELLMDGLWMAATSLGHVNYPLADVLLLHHMRAALDGSSPSRIMRSLTYEAAAEVTLGIGYFDRRAAAMMARAEGLLAATRDDYDLGWFEASCAAIAYFRARWPDTLAHAEAAERHLLRRGIGVAWERSVVHSYWLFALALTGDATALEARRRIALDDAVARRDHLAENHCRSGYTALTWLFRDDIDAARSECSRALGAARVRRDRPAERWPESSFSTPDYHALLADCHVELYAGDAEAAHARVTAAWPLITSAQLLRIQFVGVDLRFLRARCALAASRRSRDRRLVDLAARERAHIARDPNPTARPYHALLGGLIAGAPELFDDAARGFDELAMAAHAAAARFRRGELLGGRGGDRLRDEAHDRLRGLGIARPERIVEMYAPRAL